MTLASPLGLDDTVPQRFGALSGIKIPALSEVGSAHALRITGRWLNVWASGDRIGGKIDLPSVVNVSFSLEQSSTGLPAAHRFPYKDANATRMVADVIFGARARLAAAAPAPVQQSSAPAAMPSGSTGIGAAQGTIASGALVDCPDPATRAGLSASDAALALGPARDQARAVGIEKLARQNQLAAPLAPEQMPAMLKGATGAYRAQAIAQIARFLKARLSGNEGAMVLGSSAELREQSRAVAVQSIARANCFGELAGDAALLLDGATGAYREMAVSEIAKFMKKGLPGADAANALGPAAVLREQARAEAVQALVRERVPGPWAGDAGAVLTGATGAYRAVAITALAPIASRQSFRERGRRDSRECGRVARAGSRGRHSCAG